MENAATISQDLWYNSTMKIIATSDFHGTLPEIPECDLLLIGGDVCPVWDHDRQFQADWLRSTFTEWMRNQPARMTVWIGGNHDFVLQDWRNNPRKIKELPGIYLDNSMVEIPTIIDGEPDYGRMLKIWGSPYSNQFGNWAFMKKEHDLSSIWRKIPRDIDILMVHGPMHGLGDFVGAMTWSAEKRGWDNMETSGVHTGSTSLYNQLNYDEWPNLKLFVSGHIHGAHGKYRLKEIDVHSVAHLDDQYNPTNPLVEIDYAV